jgi:hypothetical protein
MDSLLIECGFLIVTMTGRTASGSGGAKRLDRNVCAAAVHHALVPGDNEFAASSVPGELLKIVLRGLSRQCPGSFAGQGHDFPPVRQRLAIRCPG